MRRPTSRRAVLAVLVASLAIAAPTAVVAKPASGCTSGTALVFLPNPVVTTGNEDLTDQKDADQAVLDDERVAVTLTGLDGSGYLRGTWATVAGDTGDSAYSTPAAGCSFQYTRHDDRFEQVMAYYWVTRSQDYLHSLGFDGRQFPLVNGDQQRVRINQYGVDNSFATDHPKDEMRFGKGGVDDAEDAEVILHELGHQIHFSQSADFFATTEAGAISEGFGDYWAATVVEWAMDQAGVTELTEPECIMDWDSTSYTRGPIHCLRRLDEDKMYPDDLDGEVHSDGEIWSHALWNLRGAIGAAHADTAILLAQFDWVGTDMPDLAGRIVAAVDDQYGAGQAALATVAFTDRGIAPTP
jgi:hypothetical protein